MTDHKLQIDFFFVDHQTSNCQLRMLIELIFILFLLVRLKSTMKSNKENENGGNDSSRYFQNQFRCHDVTIVELQAKKKINYNRKSLLIY